MTLHDMVGENGWTRAVLKRLVTEDGICDLGPHCKIGDIYRVDMTTRCVMKWGKAGTEKVWERESVMVAASPTGAKGWMPLELLEVES